jgi:hypothetical protein
MMLAIDLAQGILNVPEKFLPFRFSQFRHVFFLTRFLYSKNPWSSAVMITATTPRHGRPKATTLLKA